MSRPPARPARTAGARILALCATAAAATSLLAACGSGQIAQTARQVAPIEGANVTRGGVAIRNAEVATPPSGSYSSGSDAPLYAAIITDDKTSDSLVKVSSTAATSVAIVGSTAAPSPSAAPSLDLRLRPATMTAFTDGGDYLQLRGLTRNLTPGTTIPVIFTFARAGDVSFDVPVATPSSPRPRPTPSPGAE